MLSLSGFGVCLGRQVVLSEVNLDLPQTGIDVLMGPVKTGKSTLMRSLAGLNDPNPSFRWWGNAFLSNFPIADGNRPALVQQHASLYRSTTAEAIVSLVRQRESRSLGEWAGIAQELLLEFQLTNSLGKSLGAAVLDLTTFQQRQIMVVAALASRPKLLFIDEPTYGLDSSDGLRFVEWLRVVGERQRIMVTLHHLGQARRLADRVALLAGGRVVIHCDKDRFFDRPVNALVDQFIRTGSLSVPSPGATAEELADGIDPPPPLPPAALRVLAEFCTTEVLNVNKISTAEISFREPNTVQESGADKNGPLLAVDTRHGEATVGKSDTGSSVPFLEKRADQSQSNSGSTVPASHPARSFAVNVQSSRYAISEQVDERCRQRTPDFEKYLIQLPSLSEHGVEDAAAVGMFMASEHRGPAGFNWILPGRLAGCPEPGVVHPLQYDLELLVNVGITYLVTLTENNIDQLELRLSGLKNIHLPINDREAPTISQAYMLVRRIQQLLDKGEVLAIHCKAGIGRTGTVLAAWMIREGGLSAATALQRLRRINPSFVQSEAQERFLVEFEADIERRLGN